MKDCDHSYEHDYGDHTYCFGCGKTTRNTSIYNTISVGDNILSNTSKDIARPKVRAVIPESKSLSKQDYYRLRKQYHISKATADKYAFCIIRRSVLFNPSGDPEEVSYLLLPIYEEKECVWWQARWWGDDKVLQEFPKLKWWSCGGSAKGIYWKAFDHDESDPYVIVEGILDAARVSQVTNAVALLGTNLTEDVLLSLPPRSRVIVFLDRDATGKAVWFQANAKRRVGVVFAEKDPSEHTAKELRNVLRG